MFYIFADNILKIIMFIKINRQADNPLIIAYQDSNIEKFRSLIESEINVNCLDNRSRSLISKVILNEDEVSNNKEFFDALIDADVHLGIIGEESGLLTLAIHCPNDSYYFKKLLKKGIDINHKNPYGKPDYTTCEPAIFIAMLDSAHNNNNIEKIEILLDHNPDLKLINNYGNPIIYYLLSSFHGDFLKIIPLLVDKGADVNQCNKDGNHCFHLLSKIDYTSHFWSISAIELLLHYNANPDVIDNKGMTPLMYCSAHGYDITCKIFMKNSCDINIRDNKGYTAAMHALMNDKFYVLEILLENKADLSIVDNQGSNIMIHILDKIEPKNPDARLIDILKKNANLLTVKNKDGICALDIINEKLGKNEYIKFKKLINNMKKPKSIEKTN